MKSFPEIFRARVTGMFAFAVLALATLASPARATLISIDRLTAGDGQLTRDTASGLDWLDVNLTVSLSPSNAAALVATGGQFEGFRLATVSEFHSLLGAAGLTTGISTTSLTQFSAVSDLLNLIGPTYSASGARLTRVATFGWLAGMPYPGENNTGGFSIEDWAPGQGADRSVVFQASNPIGSSPDTGLFLVRDSAQPNNGTSVPDTGSGLGLLAVSLFGLLALRRSVASASVGGELA